MEQSFSSMAFSFHGGHRLFSAFGRCHTQSYSCVVREVFVFPGFDLKVVQRGTSVYACANVFWYANFSTVLDFPHVQILVRLFLVGGITLFPTGTVSSISPRFPRVTAEQARSGHPLLHGLGNTRRALFWVLRVWCKARGPPIYFCVFHPHHVFAFPTYLVRAFCSFSLQPKAQADKNLLRPHSRFSQR